MGHFEDMPYLNKSTLKYHYEKRWISDEEEVSREKSHQNFMARLNKYMGE